MVFSGFPGAKSDKFLLRNVRDIDVNHSALRFRRRTSTNGSVRAMRERERRRSIISRL
jgi:hypothetical protein